jgi:hypothetical protein
MSETQTAAFKERCSACGKAAQGFFVLVNLRTGKRICLLCAEEEADRAARVVKRKTALTKRRSGCKITQ